MTIALWIIAVCEMVRTAQNFVQLRAIKRDNSARDNAYSEFVNSLKMDDKEFVRRVLEEYARQEANAENAKNKNTACPHV